MFVLTHSIRIAAPIERCFLLSTSLAIVERELRMRPVEGPDATRSEGLAVGGDRIRWEGWQLGMPQFHVSLISAYSPPHFFQDTMLAGRFETFQHDHRLVEMDGVTRLDDTIRFAMKWGPAGYLAGRVLLVPHIRGLLRRRFRLLKRLAESDEWQAYLG